MSVTHFRRNICLQNVRNTLSAKCLSAKCPVGEVSVGEISGGRNVVGEISVGKMSVGELYLYSCSDSLLQTLIRPHVVRAHLRVFLLHCTLELTRNEIFTILDFDGKTPLVLG